MAIETLILIVHMRFEILSSQGLLTKKKLYTILHNLIGISCFVLFLSFYDSCCVICHENCMSDFYDSLYMFFFNVKYLN